VLDPARDRRRRRVFAITFQVRHGDDLQPDRPLDGLRTVHTDIVRPEMRRPVLMQSTIWPTVGVTERWGTRGTPRHTPRAPLSRRASWVRERTPSLRYARVSAASTVLGLRKSLVAIS
jgi:hypothetical protein